MAISRINAQNASGTGTTSASATYGSTPTQGDLLIAIVMDDARGNISTISGWNAITPFNTSLSSVIVYYKVAGASEPTTVTTAVDSLANQVNILIYEYTGFAGTPILDQSLAFWTNANAGLVWAAGPTKITTQNNQVIIAAASGLNNNTLSSWSNGFSAISSVGTEKLFAAELFVTLNNIYSTAITTTGSSASIWMSAIATFYDSATYTNHVQFNNEGLRPHPFSPGLAR